MKASEHIVDCNTLFGFFPLKRVDISVERLLSVMEAHHIERALTASTKGIFYDHKEGNDETVAASRQYSQLIPVATLDPRADLDFRDEIEKRVEQGVKVFRFFPGYQEWPLRLLPFRRCLEQLCDHRVILMLPYLGPGSCSDILEASGDLDLPTIIPSVPYSQLRETIVAMQLNGNIRVGTRLLSSPTALGVIEREVGCDRMVFGSGAPLYYPGSAIEIVAHSNLADDDKRRVFSTNLIEMSGA